MLLWWASSLLCDPSQSRTGSEPTFPAERRLEPAVSLTVEIGPQKCQPTFRRQTALIKEKLGTDPLGLAALLLFSLLSCESLFCAEQRS